MIAAIAIAKKNPREIEQAVKDFERLPESQKKSPENAPLLAVAKSLEAENAKKARLSI